MLARGPQVNSRQRRSYTLTDLVKRYLAPRLRDRAHLIRRHLASRLRASDLVLSVPPSRWTEDTRRGPLVGTVFDYLLGAQWAHRPLDRVLERAERACGARAPEACWTFPLLRDTLTVGHIRNRSDGSRRRHRNFYRALALLGELDGVFRSSAGRPPTWTAAYEGAGAGTFRRELRRHYPVEFVTELHALIRGANSDLPSLDGRAIAYNPIFDSLVGDVKIRADGDLLIDDLLLDAKVYKRPELQMDFVLQLLSYAALDCRNGSRRIQRVGIYNPRWRLLWVESLADVSFAWGWGSFAGFQQWFEEEVGNL